MKSSRYSARVLCGLIALIVAEPLGAAEYPAPKEASWMVRDFRFHSGEVLPELRLH